jgi:hypothetical protein
MSRSFAITKITPLDSIATDLVAATVEIRAANAIAENDEFMELVSIRVITKSPSSATREDLQEAIVAAAVSRLAQSLEAVKDRSAKDLLSSATAIQLKIPPRDFGLPPLPDVI